MNSGPLLTSTATGERLELKAAGAWTAANAGELERLIDGVAGQRGVGSIDMRAIQALDTFGAWLLERLLRERRSRGEDMQVIGLPDRFGGLIREVHNANLEVAPKPRRHNPVLRFFDGIGRGVSETAGDIIPMLHMLGALAATTMRVIVRPSRFRLTSAVHHLDRVGWQAVPIILLITFLIGGIIAQQGIFHFRKFGADDLCRRHGRHPRAARDRRADRRHHGGRPLGQRPTPPSSAR